MWEVAERWWVTKSESPHVIEVQKAMLWRTSYMFREPYKLPRLLTPCDHHHHFKGDKRWRFRDGEVRPRSPGHDVAEMELECWLAETKSCAPV